MKEHLIDMLDLYGLAEIEGPESNPQILDIFKELGYYDIKDDSTTAWCSALANYFCFKYGYERSKSLAARSWLNVGEKVDNPEKGDIVIFWRESKKSWKGHVGFFISKVGNLIYTLGGNQSNGFIISAYPEERLLGYRRLRKLNK